MPETAIINVNGSKTFEAPVGRIDVAVGPVSVTRPTPEGDDPIDAVTLHDGDSYDAEGHAGISVAAPHGGNVSVTYADDVRSPETFPARTQRPVPANAVGQRGDSATGTTSTTGGTGSFESRTTKELRAVAKERGITGASKLNKADLIDRLRQDG